MNRNSADTRNRGKGYTLPKRIFQYAGTASIFVAVLFAASFWRG